MNNVDLVSAMAGAVFTLLGVIVTSIASVFINKKTSYVHIVVEKRLKSVEERRQLLKDLIYYTEPQVIDKYIRLSDKEKQFLIEELLHIKAGFHYRMVEAFYPEKEILKELDLLVNDTISQIRLNESDQTKNNQAANREKCIRLIQIYNFASWRYVQNQSSGKKADSIREFEKEYKNTLKDVLKCQRAFSQINKNSATLTDKTQIAKHKQSREVKNYKELLELTNRYIKGA